MKLESSITCIDENNTMSRCDVCYHALRFEFCLDCHVERVTCSECSVQFSSFEKFRKHLNEHSHIKENVLECDFLLSDREQRKLFACVFCAFLCDKIATLVTHERTVHKTSKTFSCAHCEARFSTRVTMIHHLRRHNGEPSFECKICEKKFYERRRLEQHEHVHSSELNYQCEFCEKPFKTKFLMQRHVLQHSSEKFYRCHLCDKSFKFHFSLKRHLSTHNQSSETYKCQQCGKAYVWKGDLRRHINAEHLKIKRHECKTCLKTFTRKTYLMEHQTSHSQAKTFLCFCGKSFRYRSNLTRHARRIHKN